MDKVEQRAWELLEAECGKPLPFDVPVHAALSAIRAALAQQPDDIASGGCTADGAHVWCNGHVVATAHGLTLAPYRAARIAACVNACAGIADPVAFVQIAQQPPAADEAMVERIAALLHEEATGEPWAVAGVAHPGPDRDYYRGLARKVAALATQHQEPTT